MFVVVVFRDCGGRLNGRCLTYWCRFLNGSRFQTSAPLADLLGAMGNEPAPDEP